MISEEKLMQMTVDNALAIATLTEVSKRTSEDIDKLIKHTDKFHQMQQEHSTILGKIGHLENTVSIDKRKLKWIYAIAEYPKISISIAVTTYMFALKDVRDAVGVQLQPLISFIMMAKDII